MMWLAKRIWIFSACIFIMGVFSGCAAPGPNISADNEQTEAVTPWPDGVYDPKLPLDITTLDAAKKDLAALLQFKYFDDQQTGIKYYGSLDFNASANRNNLAGYLKRVDAGVLLYDAKYEFLYMLPRSAILALDDRINVPPAFTFYYTDFLDSHITVEKSREQEIHISWVNYIDWTADNEAYSGQYLNLDPYRRAYRRPYVIHCGGLISFFFKKQGTAQRFADDLFFIQQTLKKREDERRANFESKAAQYRALTIKPPVSEEQRKYIVQANVANQQKDYSGAIEMYRKALELDPTSYPGAYFNLALLSAQIKRFNPAIGYMKQYLSLVPDAADARSAQDKIYEWEFLMQKYK